MLASSIHAIEAIAMYLMAIALFLVSVFMPEADAWFTCTMIVSACLTVWAGIICSQLAHDARERELNASYQLWEYFS